MITDYNEFRSIAYKKATVFTVTTLGETTLVTQDEDGNYYSWLASGQSQMLSPNYSRLIVTNATSKNVNGGWMVILTLAKEGTTGTASTASR
jgi:hypothetical protein